MSDAPDTWITAHRDLADEVFSDPLARRLLSIRERLAGHGYALKLDVGKTSTRATVTNKALRVKTNYKTLDGFMEIEEARLTELDAAASKTRQAPAEEAAATLRGA